MDDNQKVENWLKKRMSEYGINRELAICDMQNWRPDLYDKLYAQENDSDAVIVNIKENSARTDDSVSRA